MTAIDRLTKVFESAEVIEFDSNSKFILFSDCHRGDYSWADDFAPNQKIFFYALTQYYKKGFTCIENGDADELWENKSFLDIRKAHSMIFTLLKKFYDENRYYLIWGNHDIERKNPKDVKNSLYYYYSEKARTKQPLFMDIKVHEGLILEHSDTGKKIFIVHGHQVDLLGTLFWRISRFFVRHVWRPLQIVGIKDPTSPAQNFKKAVKVEGKVVKWAQENHQMVIAGHTHRPIFPPKNQPQYFNTGSCIYPNAITGIEIENNEITLIQWSLEPNDDGILSITKTNLERPGKL